MIRDSNNMGRQQKIKQQRKLEHEQEILRKKNLFLRLFSSRASKWILGSGIIAAAIVFAVLVILPKPEGDKNQNQAQERIAVIETNKGVIKFKLFQDKAPKTSDNFVKLANEKFYDGIKFHRVIKDFMIQTGDPNSRDNNWNDDGSGGPGYSFEDEINDYKLIRGRVAMANSGPNTNGSQFFIVTAESAPWLDGKHTVFGEVIEGMDVVDSIESEEVNANKHPLKDIVMEKVYIEGAENSGAAGNNGDAKNNQGKTNDDNKINFQPEIE